MVYIYKIGEYIICGQHGVCVIEDIGAVSFLKTERNRVYYTLNPVYTQGGKVYVPADSDKIIMRPLLTETEAEELIQNMEELDSFGVENANRRESAFKEALRTCDCKEWVKVIKTIYSSRQTRIKIGKKITANDEKYLHMAEERLYGELAILLNIDKNEVEQYLSTKIHKEHITN